MSGQVAGAGCRGSRFKPLTDSDRMPFQGRFHGVPMENVPAWYLDLCVDWRKVRQNHPDIVDYVERNRAAIDAELEEQGRI